MSEATPAGESPTRLKKAVKPALKKAGSTRKKGDGSNGPEGSDRHLNWDEEVIAEHDLLRGTRMKIDEPNTPYHYDSGSETDGSKDGGGKQTPPSQQSPRSNKGGSGDICWNKLQNKLDSVAAVRDAQPSSPSSHHEEEGEEDLAAIEAKKAEMKKLEFQEHRKRHYNEMEMVRRFRAQQALEDEEDADDEEG